MIETENKATQSQGDPLADLKGTFAFIRNAQENNGKNDGTSDGILKGEEILTKFFTPRNSKETFRILKPKLGEQHINTAYFHVIKVANEKGFSFKKIYCTKCNDPKVPKKDVNGNIMYDPHNNPIMVDAHCSLCDNVDTILNTQDKSLKGIKKEDYTADQKKINENNKEIFKNAMSWEAKQFYIIKGVDKGTIKDGVKFWRFKHNFKNQGILNKLGPALTNYYDVNKADFSDSQEGCDLSISVVDSTLPNGNTYKDVTAIFCGGKSKLHDDPSIVEAWESDPLTWRDVFRRAKAPNITPDQYNDLVVEGNAPYFDKSDEKNKKWVFPNHPDLEKQANTRDENFSVNNGRSRQYASDLNTNVNIHNVTQADIIPPKENENMSGNITTELNSLGTQQTTNSESTIQNPPVEDVENSNNLGNITEEDIDDLPF